MADEWIGRQLGNFTITGLLGAGGMGAVYAGRHTILQHRVAIKVMHARLLRTDQAQESVKRFIAEGRALTQIDSPHVIRLHDFGELEGGHLYYVMEHLEGHDLERELHGKLPLSIAEALPYLEQICAGLEAVHAHRIVHRDLKPANVFVLDEQPLRLKLLDFGISKRLDTAQHMTVGGMGSPLFAAPEQALAEVDRISPRTDLYSLGVIAYELLSGKLHYDVAEDAHPYSVLMLPVHKDPVPLRERVPDVAPGVAAAVEQCLARDPDARPRSARDFLCALVEGSGSLATTVLPPREAAAAAATVPQRRAKPPSAGLRPIEPAPPASDSLEARRVRATTMGGSAGELTSPPASLERGGRRWLALATVGVIVVVGGGFLVSRGLFQAEPANTPPVAAKPTTTPPLAAASAPAPASKPDGRVPVLEGGSARVDASPATTERPARPRRARPSATPAPAVPAAGTKATPAAGTKATPTPSGKAAPEPGEARRKKGWIIDPTIEDD